MKSLSLCIVASVVLFNQTVCYRGGFSKFTQLHVMTSQFIMLNLGSLRVGIEDKTGSRHVIDLVR